MPTPPLCVRKVHRWPVDQGCCCQSNIFTTAISSIPPSKYLLSLRSTGVVSASANSYFRPAVTKHEERRHCHKSFACPDYSLHEPENSRKNGARQLLMRTQIRIQRRRRVVSPIIRKCLKQLPPRVDEYGSDLQIPLKVETGPALSPLCVCLTLPEIEICVFTK